jgi:hypothetical protein
MNKRIGEQAAGYLELDGARKDGDCSTVEVSGGISRDGGCCNNWTPESDAKNFSCGTCEFVTGPGQNLDGQRPLGKREARKMSMSDVLNSSRPAATEEEEE